MDGITGITDKVDVANADSSSLALKKSQQSYDKVTSGSLFTNLQKTEVYKTGTAALAARIGQTGQSMIPVAVYKEYLAILSSTPGLTASGVNLVDVSDGLDAFLASHGGEYCAERRRRGKKGSFHTGR